MIHGAQYEDDDGGSFTTTPTFFQTLEYIKSKRKIRETESSTVVLSHSLFETCLYFIFKPGESKRILLLPKGA